MAFAVHRDRRYRHCRRRGRPAARHRFVIRRLAEAVVSISGPQISVAETRLWSLRNAMRRGGMAEADIEHALALWRELI